MALALVGGAAIGALFGALYDVVKESIGRTVMRYKPLLGDLKFTLDSLRPRIIQQIGDNNIELGLPNDEIESLQRQMEEGIELVRKLSNVGVWNCYIWCSCCNCRKPSYTDQLIELDRSLRILLEILKLQEARDVKEVLLLARKIHDKQDELEKRMSDLLTVQREAGNAREISGSNTNARVREQNGGNGGQQVAPLDGGVGAATLGAVFGVLFDTVMHVKDKTMMLKRPLGDLNSTLESLKPLIEEAAEYNKILNLPKEELENVRIQIEKGVELVRSCSKVRQWASYKRYEYTNKLLGLDESLQRLLSILRVQLARDVRESLVSVSNMETMINQMEGSIVVQVQNDQIEVEGSCERLEAPEVALNVLNVSGTGDMEETLDSETNIEIGVKQSEGTEVQSQADIAVAEPPSLGVGLDEMNMQLGTRDVQETSISNAQAVIQGKGVSKVEALDAEYVPASVTVSLDVLTTELKRELLKDEISSLVLRGPRGCGKTTLAEKFCQDEEVKNKFKDNIFFVRVSKEPDLKLIVQELIQQVRYKASWKTVLQDKAIEVDWLHQILIETGQHPSLLVLDDVWPGSESLLSKFDKLKRSNYKILVTTRYELPTFGPHYYLKFENDVYTMTHSHHSRAYSFESLNDEDLILSSPELEFVSLTQEVPMTQFDDTSAFYKGDRSSYVSKDARPMAHFHDSSASSMGDRSSYLSKDAGTKLSLDNPVKSTQTHKHQKLELKMSAGDKTMRKVMKAVGNIRGLDSASWDAKNQKLTVVGQLNPVLIATRLRKIASETELISVGPAKEEIKEDKKEETQERFLSMKEIKEEKQESISTTQGS